MKDLPVALVKTCVKGHFLLTTQSKVYLVKKSLGRLVLKHGSQSIVPFLLAYPMAQLWMESAGWWPSVACSLVNSERSVLDESLTSSSIFAGIATTFLSLFWKCWSTSSRSNRVETPRN